MYSRALFPLLPRKSHEILLAHGPHQKETCPGPEQEQAHYEIYDSAPCSYTRRTFLRWFAHNIALNWLEQHFQTSSRSGMDAPTSSCACS